MARTRFARSRGVRIAYELRGRRWRRRPWLVLVQGLGFDRFGWDPVLPRLERHVGLVLVDNRGSGRSDPSASGITVADMARDVVAVLDSARISRAHVVGASLGGMVAQELAIDHAGRVDRLVLACTTPGWPYAYPMPPASTRLMADTRSLPREVALRRHVRNALSTDTVARRPELVERLVDVLNAGITPCVPSVGSVGGYARIHPHPARHDESLSDWPRPAPATAPTCGSSASGHARWSCTATPTRWWTRATPLCSRSGSRGRSW